MGNKPEVAIVLGTYQRLPLLKDAVESARLAVGALPYFFVVVDGGSTDGSREWLAAQSDIVLIGQRGDLTGAVRAFNLGFAYAVDQHAAYVVHFNDDAVFETPLAIAQAVGILKSDATIGEVAFEFDLRGCWSFDEIHGSVYANFGVVRIEAGMSVAREQGDASGCKWWNPIYRTYGADSEFGCWLWCLGWTIHAAKGLRVHDRNEQDALRKLNEADGLNRPDSKLFWERWSAKRFMELKQAGAQRRETK